MSDSILVRLLKAYKEEGYEISVGLNPLRESPNGHFAYLVKSSMLKSPSAFFDKDYCAYEIYLKKKIILRKK